MLKTIALVFTALVMAAGLALTILPKRQEVSALGSSPTSATCGCAGNCGCGCAQGKTCGCQR